MGSKRTRYSAEFKAEAVRLVEEHKMTPTEVGRDLGVHSSLISRWVKASRERAKPDAMSASDKAELARLRRENEILRQEREILKNHPGPNRPGVMHHPVSAGDPLPRRQAA